MNEEPFCPHCGASTKKFWHRITPGLVDTLVRAYVVICEKGKNVVNRDELNLGNSAYTNLYKLRYHGLLVKHIVNGEWKKGEWLITKRGGEFLRGEILIPVRVQTFRNKVVAHDEEMVNLADIRRKNEGSVGYFEKHFEFELADDVDMSEAVVRKRKKQNKKKILNPCPTCGEETKWVIPEMNGPVPNQTIMVSERICPNGHITKL